MTNQTDTQSQYFEDLHRLLSSSEGGVDDRVERAIQIGCERLGVEHGVVTHTADGQYEVIGSTIKAGKFSAGSVTELATTWCRHVVDDEEPLAFADVDTTEYAEDIARDETDLVCYIGVPLIVDGEVYGTLCFSNETPRGEEFTEIDRQFVTVLGEWIAYEIERARHHQELRAQNERLDEFTGVVAHNLRNPLTAALGYTELALEQAEGTQAEYLQTVMESLDRMQSLIDGLLSLAKEGADVGDRTQVRVADVAYQAWKLVRSRDATLEIDSEKVIYANESRLQQVFENLFRNAVEHCEVPRGQAPRLPVSTTRFTDSTRESIGSAVSPGVDSASPQPTRWSRRGV